jgi:hypothetical protein
MNKGMTLEWDKSGMVGKARVKKVSMKLVFISFKSPITVIVN